MITLRPDNFSSPLYRRYALTYPQHPTYHVFESCGICEWQRCDQDRCDLAPAAGELIFAARVSDFFALSGGAPLNVHAQGGTA